MVGIPGHVNESARMGPLATQLIRHAGNELRLLDNNWGINLGKLESLRNPGTRLYFHSHIFEMVFPAPSMSYSKAAQALLRRASFCEAVLKNNMPR